MIIIPNRVVVTEKHFDPEETQELFILFLKYERYSVGDKVNYFGFRRWIDKRAKEYRKLNNMRETQHIYSLGKEQYINYIRGYVCGIPGQTTIFDFSGG